MGFLLLPVRPPGRDGRQDPRERAHPALGHDPGHGHHPQGDGRQGRGAARDLRRARPPGPGEGARGRGEHRHGRHHEPLPEARLRRRDERRRGHPRRRHGPSALPPAGRGQGLLLGHLQGEGQAPGRDEALFKYAL
ncbi:MAG: hypothetical protein M0C28_39005 [Candidatus Moduliflexus flocculans]|nr:hypothetical protein [Candidatus Moduliflexus flocculans]